MKFISVTVQSTSFHAISLRFARSHLGAYGMVGQVAGFYVCFEANLNCQLASILRFIDDLELR